MSTQLVTTYTLKQLPHIAEKLIVFAGNSKVWMLDAPMGAGKTTLIKEICNALKCNEKATSPTFTIMNQYYSALLEEEVYHFDFYRIKNEIEALDLGADEYFYSGKYCLIEWPSLVRNLWPQKYLHIHIQITNDTQRTLTATMAE